MAELVKVFHGTKAVRAALEISNLYSDLYHAHRIGNPTPNLSTLLEDAWAHAVGGAVLEFAVPLHLLLLAGMADPNNPIKWYTPIARVPSGEYHNLPHDFRRYLADPLHFIYPTDIAAPSRWPEDLVITVLPSIYFKQLHISP